MRQNLKFKSKSKNFPLGRREGDWGMVPEWGMEGEGGGVVVRDMEDWIVLPRQEYHKFDYSFVQKQIQKLIAQFDLRD